MASRRFNATNELQAVETLKAIHDISEKEGNKLVFVIFNKQFPESGNIEYRMMAWLSQYEKEGKVKFYRCVIQKGSQQIKTDCNITCTPTIIYYRNGREIGRFDNPEELKAKVGDTSKPGEKRNNEEILKTKLDELCKST